MRTKDRGLRIEDQVQDTGRGEISSLSPQSSMLDPAALQRVRWRCRRGLLELDIVFGRFVDTHYSGLTASERQTFDELLDMPDNPLWDMISGRKETETESQAALLAKIKSV
ncbi:MAG: succinate dehydrogenase assembly factor 2 [Gallionella sp.]|jgi:antitoxin CptB